MADKARLILRIEADSSGMLSINVHAVSKTLDGRSAVGTAEIGDDSPIYAEIKNLVAEILLGEIGEEATAKSIRVAAAEDEAAEREAVRTERHKNDILIERNMTPSGNGIGG